MTESKWIKPTEGFNAGLKIYNSITGQAEEFIPKDGKNVGWYICGPTVYDSSHLGHARNYVIFDVLRRILTDYFGYNVFYVMNITDIDDKIIIRAHYRQLSKVVGAIKTLKELNPKITELINGDENFTSALTTGEELIANDSKEIAKLQQFHSQLSSLARSTFPSPSTPSEEKIYKDFEEFSIQKGYLELAQIFEKEFLEDMEKLGVRASDALTRVSEYVPEIVDYIKKIIDNGFAYEAAGNVYFDIQQFKKAGFEYNKTSHLEDKLQTDLLAEGEGALAAAEGKRNANDFALWKRSKPGEPQWESPWGMGRPGWHIECSAMCSDLLGSNVDINCGGVDLKFPHHDNQLAQSEAHFGCKQWVNYFLHSGHLHIAKLKMAKTLKNFITIRECLRHYRPRHLRLFFLMHRFSSNLDIDMVGGGPPKLGGQTGILKIISSRVGSLNLTSQLQGLVVNENSIFIEKGTNLRKLFNLEELSLDEKAILEIEYLSDGIKRIGGWDLNGVTFELEEALEIKAGGKINQLEEMVSIDKIFSDFFLNIKALLKELPTISDVGQKWNKSDRALFNEFQTSRDRVHAALCDSFNTPEVISILLNLTNQTYAYIKEFSTSLKRSILNDIVTYISHIFKVFGLIYDDDYGYQWSESRKDKVEKDVGDLLDEFTKFRDSVRAYARAKQSAEITQFCDSTHIPSPSPHPSQPIFDLFTRFRSLVRDNANNSLKVLQICDEVRDDLILQLGVRFEDDHFVKGKSIWKLDDLDSTLADRKKKKEELIFRLHVQAEKEAKKRAEEEKKRAQEEIFRIPPEVLFQKSPEHAGKFSSFDEKGIPTHDADGKEISKGLRKKLETLQSKHATKHRQLIEKEKKQ